jgi:hypothetical protein
MPWELRSKSIYQTRISASKVAQETVVIPFLLRATRSDNTPSFIRFAQPHSGLLSIRLANYEQSWVLSRRTFVGGSDARTIMGHDESALIRLWREKRGEVGPEDLSDNLIVQLGKITEDLYRTWYERTRAEP